MGPNKIEELRGIDKNTTQQMYLAAGVGVILEPPPTNVNLLNNAQIRAQFLEHVKELVCKDRNITHGDAEDNFKVIADLWNAYLKNGKVDVLTNKDIAIMMCLFKISRLMSNVDNLENWLDLAGYAACGGGIVKKSLDNK